VNSIDWEIRREGRAWNEDEAKSRVHVTPERLEFRQGKLFANDEERLTVLACLLENLGLEKVVRVLSTPEAWTAAVRAAESDSLPEKDSDSLAALADRAAVTFADFEKNLDRYFGELQRLEPEVAHHATERAESAGFAAFLLFCPTDRLGGKSMLQLWAAGEVDRVGAFFLSDI